MSPQSSLAVYRENLATIVQSVFETMMNLAVAVNGDSSPGSRAPAAESVTAAVHFVGAWRGAALLECGLPVACRFASRFMGIDPPAAMNDDVRDVVGELANMVAGNLKSLLPKGVDLSMPAVVEGSDYTHCVCGLTAAERLSFSSESGPFRITLLEMLQPV